MAAAASDLAIDNPLDGLLGYQLRRASATVVADLARSLVDLALTPSEASVLVLIAANPGVTQSEVGRALAIKRANMAPIAAMLTERGWIERSRSDGRSQELRASARGAAVADDVRRRIAVHEARFVTHLSDADRTALVATVRRVWRDDHVPPRTPAVDTQELIS